MSFLMSQFFTSGGQSIGSSTSASVPPMNIQDWFPLGIIGLISLQSKGLSRVFSNATVQKHQFFCTQPSLWSDSQHGPNDAWNYAVHIPNTLGCPPAFSCLWLLLSTPVLGWGHINETVCLVLITCMCFMWFDLYGLSLIAQMVMQKTWVWSLDQEDPLEKEMATHSSILAWEIPWTEEPGRLQGCKE